VRENRTKEMAMKVREAVKMLTGFNDAELEALGGITAAHAETFEAVEAGRAYRARRNYSSVYGNSTLPEGSEMSPSVRRFTVNHFGPLTVRHI
jgi:hypothetical protein